MIKLFIMQSNFGRRASKILVASTTRFPWKGTTFISVNMKQFIAMEKGFLTFFFGVILVRA
jgi:hypothetical protein